ncbi:hypothetical protein GCM10017788_62180 [Amycolatopsis acidiphila]|nr:hypothetical protein GCM10017788_62180 [Amycolatopsis acidiphila]
MVLIAGKATPPAAVHDMATSRRQSISRPARADPPEVLSPVVHVLEGDLPAPLFEALVPVAYVGALRPIAGKKAVCF